MTGPRQQWITTTEAAQRLGVKRATLYAYVSRGLVHSERRPGQQESLFDRGQIEALAAASRGASAPQPVLRLRSVATAVSSQVDGDLLYRRVPLADVVAGSSLEEAAALVMGTPVGSGPDVPGGARALRAVASSVRLLPLGRRVPVAVQSIGAVRGRTAPDDAPAVRAVALDTVRRATAMLDPQGAAAAPDDLAATSLAVLRGEPGTRAEADTFRVLLVALLDHGLTASTIAARVAASTRADVHECLTAAYAAMSGPLHGAAPVAAHRLVAEGSRLPADMAGMLARTGHVPGFGHFLYPGGDPRAEIVLEHLWRRRGTRRLRARADELFGAVRAAGGAAPNIDVASALVLSWLGLPAAAGEVVFQMARSFGVVAHVLEEYDEEPLRWRGHEAVG